LETSFKIHSHGTKYLNLNKAVAFNIKYIFLKFRLFKEAQFYAFELVFGGCLPRTKPEYTPCLDDRNPPSMV